MTTKQKTIILAFMFLLLIVFLSAWWLLNCSTEISGSIGEFPSKDAAFRASIKEINSEVQRCPRTETYRIIWTVKDDPMRQSTLYYRARDGNAYIGHEQDAYSGFSEKSYSVDDRDVKAVAEKGGTLEDFSDYDRARK